MFSMRIAYVEIMRGCNLNCVFCSQGNRSGVLKSDDIRKTFNKYLAQGYRKLSITGGEPFLHPDLIELVRYASDIGFETGIQTNGTLVTPDNVVALKNAGLEQIVFSIHSHIPALTDKIMNGKGVLKKQLNGLELAHKAGISVFVATTIVKQNYPHLFDFFNFMVRHFDFINHYVLNFVDAVGRSGDNNAVVPKVSECELDVAKALFFLKHAKKTFRVERIPLCYLLEFAEYNTELRRLVTREDSVGSREKEFKLFTKEYFEDVYQKSEACNICRLNSICPGVNKNYHPTAILISGLKF